MSPRDVVRELRLASFTATEIQAVSGVSTPNPAEGPVSTIVKVVEIIAQSDKGFSEAVSNAVREVGKTVHDIKSVWVDNFTCSVEKGAVIQYRANVKVSFLVEGHK